MKGSQLKVITDPLEGDELVLIVKNRTNRITPISNLLAAATFEDGQPNEFLAWDQTWKEVQFGYLSDVTPYTISEANKYIRVNSSATGLEYTSLDLSGYVTIDTAQDITSTKTFTSGNIIQFKSSSDSIFKIQNSNTLNSFSATMLVNSIGSNNVTWTLPSNSGTIALTSDLYWTVETYNSQSYIKRNGRVIIGNETTGTNTNSLLTIKALTQFTTDATSIWLEKDYNYFLAKIDAHGGIHAGRSIEIGGPDSVSRRITANPYIRFRYPSTTGRYIAFYMSSEPASNIVFYLPYEDGTNGQALVTNGAGQLTWATVGGGSTYTIFTNTANGLVPAPNSATPGSKFLRDDATWQTISSGIVTYLKVNDGTYRSGQLTLETISGGGIDIVDTSGVFRFTHADTSSVVTPNNSGFSVVQNLTFDTYGHVLTASSLTLSIFTSSSAGLVPAYTTAGHYLSTSGWVALPTGTSHDPVTLTGQSYLTLSGQQITANQVNLSSHVTGNLPVSRLNGGTDASAATFWRGDGMWAIPLGGGGSGTVTSITAGNGMSFTTITVSGSVSMGTPSSITADSINSVTTGTHTHKLLFDTNVVLITDSSGEVFELPFGNANTILTSTGSGLVWSDKTFIALTDTPSTYIGNGGKGVRVNSTATALEFYTIGESTGNHNLISSVHPDIQINNLQVGQILKWNGSHWVNSTDLTASGGGDGYINNASFTGGNLILTGEGSAGASVSLDGRYLKIDDYYDVYPTAVSVSGTTTKYITITLNNSTSIQSVGFTDLNNYVDSISGSGNGTLTLTRTGLSNLTVDLTHTHNYVPSFNTRTGAITLTKNDVESVLTGIITSHEHNYTNNAGTVTSVTAGLGLYLSGVSTVNPTLNIQSHLGTAGSIGTIVVTDDHVGVALGNTSITAAPGNHNHDDVYLTKHYINDNNAHFANNSKVFYSNSSGLVTELSLGANDTIFTSSGTASNPTFKSFYSFDAFDGTKKALVPIASPLEGASAETRFLRADGVWIAPSGTGGGMSNPMTSVGDIIIGSTGGTPIRLAASTNGYILTLASGSPIWAAPGAYTHGNHTGEVNSVNMVTTLDSSAITNRANYEPLEGNTAVLNATDNFLIYNGTSLYKNTALDIKKYVLNYMGNTTSTVKVLISASSNVSWFNYSFIGIPNGVSSAGTANQLLKWYDSGGGVMALTSYTPGTLSSGSGITTFTYNGFSAASISIDTSVVSIVGHKHILGDLILNVGEVSRIIGSSQSSNNVTALQLISNTPDVSSNALYIENSYIGAKLEKEATPKLNAHLNVNGKNLINTGNLFNNLNNSFDLGSSSYRYKDLHVYSVKLPNWSMETSGNNLVFKYGGVIKATFQSDGKILAVDNIIAFA